MTEFEDRLAGLLKQAAADPPRDIQISNVQAYARRQARQRWMLTAAVVAVVLGVAIGLPLGLTGHSRGSVTVVGRGKQTATITVTPSQDLAPFSEVHVTLQGFPPSARVYLSECASANDVTSQGCLRIPGPWTLVTDADGSAGGTTMVSIKADTGPHAEFGVDCASSCVLMATTGPGDSTGTAHTPLGFRVSPPPATPTTRPPGPSGFEPAAASFVSPLQGWVLGRVGCADCAGLLATRDGGASWTALPALPMTLGNYPSSSTAVVDIAFANQADGYLFSPGLFATSNGGRSWTDQDLSDIQSITIAGSYAYALSGYQDSGPIQLWRSPIGVDEWTKVALPAVPGQQQTYQLARAGTDIILLETGDSEGFPGSLGQVWVGTDQGTHWQPRTMPCTTSDGGAALISVALDHPDAWLLVCYNGEQSSQEQNTEQHTYGTADGGGTWVRLANPPQHNAPTLLADNGSGHAILATEGGGADTLVGTLDGGLTWSVQLSHIGFSGWADLSFITPQFGYVVGPTQPPGYLNVTTDGGQTWNAIPVSP